MTAEDGAQAVEVGDGPRVSALAEQQRAQRTVGALGATQEDAVPHDVEASAERIQHQHQRGQADEVLRVARVEHPIVQDRHIDGSRQRHQVDCGRTPEDRGQQAAAARDAQCSQEIGRPFSPLPFAHALPRHGGAGATYLRGEAGAALVMLLKVETNAVIAVKRAAPNDTLRPCKPV